MTGLPVERVLDTIIATVGDHPVTIVSAETGSGKSTLVPPALHAAGYKVIVTQPRRIAARSVAQYVAEKMGSPLGGLVGYRTAEERNDSIATEVLFCTDGLQLVRELTGHGVGRHALVIDEVHEWNLNIETLVAWVKYQLANGVEMKVVLMSATMEVEKLSAYFDDAPIVTAEGSLHPVTEDVIEISDREDVERCAADKARELADQGRNVLVFLPGKAEIEDVVERLDSRAEVLPLHGSLSGDEQARVFKKYQRPKIVVATNVAETSITIDDIDAVVDTGQERRTEVRDGVEGLYLGAISRANSKQRRGRAGRTKPGMYIRFDRYGEVRSDFPTAEIMRSRLDQLVLRLAVIGLDASELEFFHQPDRHELVRAKEALGRLGALDASGGVTKIGRQMSRLPIEVHFARMIIEAQNRGVLEDVVTIVACLEAGGIRGKGKKVQGMRMPARWRTLTQESSSDLLAELDCYRAALGMSYVERNDKDIINKAFSKAKELRQRLARELKIPARQEQFGDRLEVMRSCIAGMVDHVYQNGVSIADKGFFWLRRQHDENSVAPSSGWAVGFPLDLEIMVKSRMGEAFSKTLNLLTFVSHIEPEWLREIAPHLVSERDAGLVYDHERRMVMRGIEYLYNGKPLDGRNEPVEASRETTAQLVAEMLETADYPDKAYNQAQYEAYHRIVREYGHGRGLDEIDIGALLVLAIEERHGHVCGLDELLGVDLKLDLSRCVPEHLRSHMEPLVPEEGEADGVPYTITYQERNGYWGGVGVDAVCRVPRDQVMRLQSLPVPSRSQQLSMVHAIDEAGVVVASSYSLEGLKSQLRHLNEQERRERTTLEHRNHVASLEAQRNELKASGRNTARLDTILRQCRDAVSREDRPWLKGSPEQYLSVVKQAEGEIARLSKGGAQLLVEDLLSGSLKHPDITFNQEVRSLIDTLLIRAGDQAVGLIDPVTDESLGAHYLQRLEGVETVDEALKTDLRLPVEDLVPDDLIEALELAPSKVQLARRRGTPSEYSVEYRVENIDGEPTKVGVVKIPLSVYQANEVSYGQTSRLPSLPYSIRLILDVMDGTKRVARGEEGETLARQVKRYKKGGSSVQGGSPGLLMSL